MTTPTRTPDDLDRALREIGPELDEYGRAYRTRPARPAAAPRRRRLAIAAISAGLVAAAVVGLAIRSRGADDQRMPAILPDVVDEMPGLTEIEQVAVRLCRDSVTEYGALDPVSAAVLPDPAIATPTVFELPNDPSTLVVVLVDGETGYSCTVPAGATEYTSNVRGHPIAPFADTVPASDSVRLDGAQWESTSEFGLVGPGSLDFTGRVGADVTSVAVVLPDGTRIPAAITDGRFAAVGDIPADVALFEESIAWTLSDGSELMAPAESLDALDPLELCAMDPACVDERLRRLEDVVRETSDFLDDGGISDDEIDAAWATWIDCARELGHAVERVGDGLFVESAPNGSGPADVPDAETTATCGDRADIDAATELSRLRELVAERSTR